MGVLVGAAAVAAGLLALAAVGAAAAAALISAAWLWLGAPRAALRRLGAQSLPRGSHRRLENIVEGLCTTHGIAEPALHTVDSGAVNAAAAGLGKAAHLVFTRGALSALDRLELEAVVARQLCEVRQGLDAATVLASVCRLPGARAANARLAGRVSGRPAVTSFDLEAVRLTCYPPALASALRKSAASRPAPTSRAVAHLWLVPPEAPAGAGAGPTWSSQRIDLLGEL